jgi:hypothetical protein
MTELKKRGIKCDDATKAQSILNSINNPMKNPETAAKGAAAKMGALNARYKGDKWSPGEVRQRTMQGGIQYYEDCRDYCDIASKRTVHNKIFELRIRVKFMGKYQLLTKKY